MPAPQAAAATTAAHGCPSLGAVRRAVAALGGLRSRIDYPFSRARTAGAGAGRSRLPLSIWASRRIRRNPDAAAGAGRCPGELRPCRPGGEEPVSRVRRHGGPVRAKTSATKILELEWLEHAIVRVSGSIPRLTLETQIDGFTKVTLEAQIAGPSLNGDLRARTHTHAHMRARARTPPPARRPAASS